MRYCKCGCKTQLPKPYIYYNGKGRHERMFINGHNGRGISRSEEVKKKISNTCLRERNTPEYIQKLKDNHSRWMKDRKGELCPAWKGGITKVNFSIRTDVKYLYWRKEVFERDDYTCQICGKRGNGYLVVHHKKPFSLILKENNIKTLKEALKCKEFWNLDNGITLCKACHYDEHYL